MQILVPPAESFAAWLRREARGYCAPRGMCLPFAIRSLCRSILLLHPIAILSIIKCHLATRSIGSCHEAKSLGNQLIRHKRDLLPIRRPAGDVDGALAAEEFAEDVDLF